jgi:hypothetical protein
MVEAGIPLAAVKTIPEHSIIIRGVREIKGKQVESGDNS